MPLELNSRTRLLFIGDSITDCGRRNCPEQIGSGYVRIIRDWLRAKDPVSAPQVINRGISGNKVTDLASRWQSDVLAGDPDILSIKIGINDVWHRFRGGEGIAIDLYREVYYDLLEQTQRTLPGCRIVLCEPSVISPPAPEGANQALQPYLQAVRALAEEFTIAAVVELHRPFIDAARQRPDIDWTTDGVHPTSSGHMLIARQWLHATGLL